MKRILLGGAVGTAVMTYSVRPKLVGESMDIVAKKNGDSQPTTDAA